MMSRRSLSSGLTSAVPSREQRYGQEHLLGRDTTVQECATIAGLILPELGGIHEEAVAGGEQKPGTWRPGGKPEAGQVVHDQRRFGILGPEIVSELVAQVRGRVALGKNGGRCVAVDGPVVRRKQHRDSAALRLTQCIPEG